MLFEDNDFDITFLNLAGLTDNKDKFVNTKEGFLKGNMFKDEYKPYKDYSYVNLVPKTEKEARLYNVMQYCFALNDLHLYLDLYPDDVEAFTLYKNLVEEEKKAKSEYVKNYGALDLCDLSGMHYDWLENWPWDNDGGSIYV